MTNERLEIELADSERARINASEDIFALEEEAKELRAEIKRLQAENAALRAVIDSRDKALGFEEIPDGHPNSVVSVNQKCPRCGYVTANVFDCPVCKNPSAPLGKVGCDNYQFRSGEYCGNCGFHVSEHK